MSRSISRRDMRTPVVDVGEEGGITDHHSNNFLGRMATIVVATSKMTERLGAARMLDVETVVLSEEAINLPYQPIARKDSINS